MKTPTDSIGMIEHSGMDTQMDQWTFDVRRCIPRHKSCTQSVIHVQGHTGIQHTDEYDAWNTNMALDRNRRSYSVHTAVSYFADLLGGACHCRVMSSAMPE